MPSASDEWSRRFEGIWRSCYCLQRSIVALRVTKPPTKHVTDGVGNIISAPAVTFFRWMPYMAPSCHRNSKSPALFPQELLEISSITRAKRWSRKEIERKSTCYNNIPRRAFLSLETLNHLKIPFNTASSRDTPKSDLFRSRASWLALSFTKSGCWLQISKSFATISSHASFRSSSSCASVRLQNAKSSAIGSAETGLNRTW